MTKYATKEDMVVCKRCTTRIAVRELTHKVKFVQSQATAATEQIVLYCPNCEMAVGRTELSDTALQFTKFDFNYWAPEYD